MKFNFVKSEQINFVDVFSSFVFHFVRRHFLILLPFWFIFSTVREYGFLIIIIIIIIIIIMMTLFKCLINCVI